MSSVSLVLLFTCNAILIGLPLAEGTCSSNSDCPGKFFNNVCCGRSWYGGRRCVTDSCVGDSCSTDGDCGGKDECCISNKCTKNGCVECQSNSDCSSSEYCCKHRYHNDHNVCRRSCVGETCHSSLDCGGPTEYCASNKKCREWCTSKSDCHSWEYCASNKKCQKERCTSNSDCNSSDYCCKRGTLTNVCRRSCVGETCLSSYDCGGSSELCSSNKICYKCVTAGCSACTSDSDCGSREYCCKRGILSNGNVCRTSCVGETCHSIVDCGGRRNIVPRIRNVGNNVLRILTAIRRSIVVVDVVKEIVSA
ncbi:Hypothetical predicted protein [Paramuricea clavata]|uniref:Uncharacterized protein n=1 Tax=Paramuricea clavata TaxID=317549 RepID=A0A6S7JHE4_PARCT|nr:Hypothetical predicted protein [Paramuricea clavata]